MSSFFQSKNERDSKSPEPGVVAAKPDVSAPARKPAQEIVSTLGPGLLVTGNVVCTGAVQIFGRVIGDIYAARLLICKGAEVEGKVVAQEVAIDGAFKGTIHSNSVKLQSTATVEGEIFKQSLVIEQNAQFEGVARRLTATVDAPTVEQIKGQATAALVPEPNAASQTFAGSPQPVQPYGANGSATAHQAHVANDDTAQDAAT